MGWPLSASERNMDKGKRGRMKEKKENVVEPHKGALE